MLRTDCLLKRIVEGKIVGRVEVTARKGRTSAGWNKGIRSYGPMKEEIIHRTVWRTGCRRGCGLSEERLRNGWMDGWMNVWMKDWMNDCVSCIPIRLESPIIALPLLHSFLCTVVPADAVCHGTKTGLSEIITWYWFTNINWNLKTLLNAEYPIYFYILGLNINCILK